MLPSFLFQDSVIYTSACIEYIMIIGGFVTLAYANLPYSTYPGWVYYVTGYFACSTLVVLAYKILFVVEDTRAFAYALYTIVGPFKRIESAVLNA